MAQRERDTHETTSTTTTTAAPEQNDRERARTAKPTETAASQFAISIPPGLEEQVESVAVEFVHDGKGDFTLPKIGYAGAAVTERVQQGAPPHAIVNVRTKAPEADPDTGVVDGARTLDFTGNAFTYGVGNVGGLAPNERHSIPLLGLLPQGDAPKAVSEGAVATG